MAAIVDFEKIAEDDETVTYRYGIERRFDHSVTIGKADRRPRVDEADFRWPASLAVARVPCAQRHPPRVPRARRLARARGRGHLTSDD